jgi:hypothetical protein
MPKKSAYERLELFKSLDDYNKANAFITAALALGAYWTKDDDFAVTEEEVAFLKAYRNLNPKGLPLNDD